jgi:hypothetical protein
MNKEQIILYLSIAVAVINGIIQTLLAVQGYLPVGQAAYITSIVTMLSTFVAVIGKIIPIFEEFAITFVKYVNFKLKGK